MSDPNMMTNQKQLILVVENEANYFPMIRALLHDEYRVETAHSAEEALAVISDNIRQLSLVMLDVQLAGTEGMALLRTIKNDARMHQVPVIVLTEEKAYEIECLQIGASDFIRHLPGDLPDVLMARVRRTIQAVQDNLLHFASDELTGIANQDAFFKNAEEYDALHPDREMDAICADVSNFHIINDLYGREEGNRILITMANVIEETAKRFGGIAGRKGGDVFWLYLPHRDDYKELLSSIQDAITEGRDYHNTLRLKMGIYPFADKSAEIHTRFDRAKLARDTIHYSYSQIIAYYDVDQYRKTLKSQQLMREMETALKEQQFKVYYQPKYDITGEKPVLVSAEALVRWEHPDLGLLYPSMFIPLFENNGLITELDRFVWEEAAAQIRRWRDKYGFAFPLSVNVSRLDMLDGELTNVLLDIVRKNGLAPSDMYIEITESAYTENFEQLIRQVDRMREVGFRIEMDDFGSGYSSLNMLSSITIDILKLDISFIRNMFGSEKNLRMLQMMMYIKDTLQVPVVAEGVETKEQLDLLKEIGCDIVQGFYFSKPIPAQSFEKLIEEKIAQQEQPR